MAQLMVVFRLFIAFILGALIGILGTVGIAYFYPQVTDTFIVKSPGVEQLRRDLDTVVAQRDDVTRRLEKLSSVLEQVERRYEDLGQRFDAMEAGIRRSPEPPPPRSPHGGPPANVP